MRLGAAPRQLLQRLFDTAQYVVAKSVDRAGWHLHGEGRLEMSPDGMNADGSMAFGTVEPDSALSFPDEGVDGAAPFRWSAASGLVSLHSLPGHRYSYAYATDAPGNVIVGRSGTQAGVSEAVLWDGAGVVGIAAYLTALGANLHSARLQRAERIATHDGTMVVQGSTDEQNRVGAWIAWLPERP